MSGYQLVPATYELLQQVAASVRPDDEREIWAASRLPTLEALRLSCLGSRNPLVGKAGDSVLCAFGVAQRSLLFSNDGEPWMVATYALERHARRFLRVSREVVNHWRKEYDVLENWVDARNIAALRWLSWLGATLEQPARPYGAEQRPFFHFYL